MLIFYRKSEEKSYTCSFWLPVILHVKIFWVMIILVYFYKMK